VAPVVTRFNADKLELMLFYLTSNALRAAPARSTVTVTVDGRFQDRIEISIHDRGPTLAADALSQLFDAPEDGAQHPRQRGMAKAKALAEAQQASLTVESLPERGTTFTLRLPKRTG